LIEGFLNWDDLIQSTMAAYYPSEQELGGRGWSVEGISVGVEEKLARGEVESGVAGGGEI